MLNLFIYVLGITLAITMAKHGRRSFANYMKGRVDEGLALSTLASTTLISAVFDETVTERTKISSIVVSAAMILYTPAAGDGPIEIGVAHSDYNDTELEEWVENTGSWDVGDNIQSKEIGRRMVRSLGMFDKADTDANAPDTINDGKPMKIKLNWILNSGQTLRLWAYNHGTSALATTNPVVSLKGHANLWTL